MIKLKSNQNFLSNLKLKELNLSNTTDDDFDALKEERRYCLWINSLCIEDLHVNNLIDECKDGIILCKVIDKID